jgi:hypothetical protein
MSVVKSSSSFRVLGCLLVIASTFSGYPQQTNRANRPIRLRPTLIPHHLLAKAAGYTPIFADKKTFNEMYIETFVFGPKTMPGLKADTMAIHIAYGFKQGGIASTYQMPLNSGVSPEAALAAMDKAGVFRERTFMKGYSRKILRDSKFMIAVTGTTPEVLQAISQAIGK